MTETKDFLKFVSIKIVKLILKKQFKLKIQIKRQKKIFKINNKQILRKFKLKTKIFRFNNY